MLRQHKRVPALSEHHSQLTQAWKQGMNLIAKQIEPCDSREAQQLSVRFSAHSSSALSAFSSADSSDYIETIATADAVVDYLSCSVVLQQDAARPQQPHVRTPEGST